MAGMFHTATSFNQDLSNWNVSQVTNLNSFLSNVTLSTSNYNKLLISWANQSLKSNVNANFGNSKYDEGLPLDSKNSIVSTYTWTITDGGSTGNPYVPEDNSPRIILGKGQRILLKSGGILKLKSI
jgi:surface protein